MDYLKSVVEPIKQVAPRSSLKGLIDDYAHMNEDVVLLEGETHLNRKPVSPYPFYIVLDLTIITNFTRTLYSGLPAIH